MCVVFRVWKRKGWRGTGKKTQRCRFCEHSRKTCWKQWKWTVSERLCVCVDAGYFPPLLDATDMFGPLLALVLPVRTIFMNQCRDRSEAIVNRCVSFTRQTAAFSGGKIRSRQPVNFCSSFPGTSNIPQPQLQTISLWTLYLSRALPCEIIASCPQINQRRAAMSCLSVSGSEDKPACPPPPHHHLSASIGNTSLHCLQHRVSAIQLGTRSSSPSNSIRLVWKLLDNWHLLHSTHTGTQMRYSFLPLGFHVWCN